MSTIATMRSLTSYDWPTIIRHKRREFHSYARHGCLLAPYYCCVARDKAVSVASVAAVLVIIPVLAVISLVMPSVFRRFLDN